ncbi:hypothetical protein KDL67_16935 [bacterium]|nr:hypothetical protein [bacterium]
MCHKLGPLRSFARGALVLGILGISGLPAPVARADGDRYGTNSRIIFQADTAPGLMSGEYVNYLHTASVGTNGNVMLFGVIRKQPEAYTSAIWSGPPDGLQLLVRSDQPVPGFEGLVPPAGIQNAAMSSDGSRVVFHTTEVTPEYDQIDRVWTRTAGVTTLAIVDSLNTLGEPAIADNGTLMLFYHYGYVNPSIYGFTRGLPGDLSLIISNAMTPPGFPVGTHLDVAGAWWATGGFPSSITRGGLLLNGSKVWTTSGDDLGRGLYLAGDGPLQRVVHAGDPAEGAPAGHTFVAYPPAGTGDLLRRASIAADGSISFQYETELGAEDWSGLWTYESGVRTLQVGLGDLIANRPGSTVRPYSDRTHLGDPGGIWFSPTPYRDAGGSLVFTGEIAETGNPAIFRAAGGQVTVLAEAGQPMEAGSDFAWYQAPSPPSAFSPFATPFVNDAGDILMWAYWDETGTGMNNSGLAPWVLDASGTSTAVVLPGDAYEFGPNDVREVEPVILNDAVRARWFRSSELSPVGHVICLVRWGWSQPSQWALVYAEPRSDQTGVPLADATAGTRISFSSQPFRGSGDIELVSGAVGSLKIGVYSATGRLVRHFLSRAAAGEVARVHWDGCSQSGDRVAAGVYFVRAEIAGQVDTKKLVLVR